MIILVTTVVLCEGFVQYTVDTLSSHQTDSFIGVNRYNRLKADTEPVTVEVIDVNGTVVSRGRGASGLMTIDDVRLWWPYTMNNFGSPYLYTLQVENAINTGPVCLCVKVKVKIRI